MALALLIAALLFFPGATLPYVLHVAAWPFANHSPPASLGAEVRAVTGLPDAGKRLAATLEKQFPIGSDADSLRQSLQKQGFKGSLNPACKTGPVKIPCELPPTILFYSWAGLLTGNLIRVAWNETEGKIDGSITVNIDRDIPLAFP